jgi:replicative DNA helicase
VGRGVTVTTPESIDDARRRHGPQAGKVLHDLQAEASLLGAMLLSGEAVVTAVGLVSPDDFYKPTHGHIFEAIQALHAKGKPADP